MSERERVREFLRARGLAEEALEGGAGALVTGWEEAARDVERPAYPFGIEDWLDELDGRQMLHDLLERVPGGVEPGDLDRLAAADQRVRAATQVAGMCLWGSRLAQQNEWTAERNWWYWRRPRAVEADFDGPGGASAGAC